MVEKTSRYRAALKNAAAPASGRALHSGGGLRPDSSRKEYRTRQMSQVSHPGGIGIDLRISGYAGQSSLGVTADPFRVPAAA
jgi:hypothetical protein